MTVEALLADEEERTEFLAAARHARKLFKAVLPDPAAADHQSTVAVIRVLAERIIDVAQPERADLDEVTDAVDDLLDRSVGAEEYVLPPRRRPLLPAGLGQDEQGRAGLLRADEQLNPSAA